MRLNARKLRLKKSAYDPSKDSPRIQALTEEYVEKVKEVAQGKFYFLDEMGAALDLIPMYGRAGRSERVYDTKPTAKGKRVSLVSALNSSGIATALTIEGTLNGSVFLYFIKQCLCPLLKAGDTVVLDNAAAHKVEGVQELIEAKGAVLAYLPPYSPEFNAIELAWNKIKQYLRKQRVRTVKHLHKAYFKALKLITPDNAQKFIKHAMSFLTKWEM